VQFVAENDAVDKALRLFVYAPLGVAAYLRDSAPSLLTVFVARGQREFNGVRRAVEERLGITQPEPPPPTPPLQRVAGGIGRLASQAGSVVVGVARPVVDAATSATSSTAPTNGEAMHWKSADAAPSSEAESTGATGSTGSTGATDLPITDYDGLSATQIIDRLDGLSRGALERIRVYELAHRARRTILATIDQLTS